MGKWIALVGALITLVSVLLIEARKRRKQRATADALRADAIADYGDNRSEGGTSQERLDKRIDELSGKYGRPRLPDGSSGEDAHPAP
jgi:hypothetical protein